jgi:hypothetical protein
MLEAFGIEALAGGLMVVTATIEAFGVERATIRSSRKCWSAAKAR